MKEIIVKMLEKMDNSYFEKIKDWNQNFISFLYIKNPNKDEFIEKVVDYFEGFTIVNKYSENDFPKIYGNELSSLLKGKYEKDSREAKYYERFERVGRFTSRIDKTILANDLQDYTRLFICLYFQQNKINKDARFDFGLSLECFEESLKLITNKMKMNYIFSNNSNKIDNKIKYSKLAYSLLILEIVYLYMLTNQPKNEGEGEEK